MMRLAVGNWSCRKVGGTEDYLEEVLPELVSLGYEVAFFSECDLPANRRRIEIPPEIDVLFNSDSGSHDSVAALERWSPDLLFNHGFLSPSFEQKILDTAPGIFFVHNYYGTCISGAKMFKYPVMRPCSRRFGWSCLVNYFPRRCGGRNPITMLRLFLDQSQRLKVLRRYAALLTTSDHMRKEFIRHGFAPEMVHKSSYLVQAMDRAFEGGTAGEPRRRGSFEGYTLLFVGRMDQHKGGMTLLDASSIVAKSLDRNIRVIFAGDGPQRAQWQKHARRVSTSNPKVHIEFTGWVDGPALERVFSRSDLLVVPSLWPEPFGRIGPLAGLHSMPVAAFAVGGIPEWLQEGINGHLACGEPPTAPGLACAIVKCLSDSRHYEELSVRSFGVARRFSLVNHRKQIHELFISALSARRNTRLAESRLDG
jgi:glycosyltransferase involved in cell wall biosynthesis